MKESREYIDKIERKFVIRYISYGGDYYDKEITQRKKRNNIV